MIFPKIVKKSLITSVTSNVKKIVASVLAAAVVTVVTPTIVEASQVSDALNAPVLMTQAHTLSGSSWHSSHSSHASHASHASHFSSRY